eukprot:4040685-Amphidinium_carterae.1
MCIAERIFERGVAKRSGTSITCGPDLLAIVARGPFKSLVPNVSTDITCEARLSSHNFAAKANRCDFFYP